LDPPSDFAIFFIQDGEQLRDKRSDIERYREVEMRETAAMFARWASFAAIVLAILTIGAGFASQKNLADGKTAEADKRTKEAIANEPRALAALAANALSAHVPADALQLALASWPRNVRDLHPQQARAGTVMSDSLSTERIPLRALHHDAAVIDKLEIPDGRLLSWSGDNTLKLWDVKTGDQIGPAMRHDGVDGALVMPDGRLMSWSHDGTLMLWDAQTGRQIGPAMRHEGEGPVHGALVMPDLLSWSGSWRIGTLMLWDAKTGRQTGPAMRHEGAVLGALVMPDGRLLSWSTGGTLKLWDLR
jgi:hypothetical protein